MTASTTSCPLKQFFVDELGVSEIHYLPNHGNAGDALISAGTICFFESIGVKLHWVRDLSEVRDQTVVFAGGGALVGLYRRSEDVVKKALKNGNHVVVLPHTIKDLDDELIRKGSRLTIFCRELRSYEYLSSLKGLESVRLAEDMAFHLQGYLDEFLDRMVWSLAAGACWGGGFKQTLRVIKHAPEVRRAFNECHRLAEHQGGGVLNCFRTDIEKAKKVLPVDNQDISDLFAVGTQSPGGSRFGAWLLLKTLERFDEIHTDRLHCCIGGLLLGKKIRFFGNSYFKNEAVFRYSIEENYPNVTWVSE